MRFVCFQTRLNLVIHHWVKSTRWSTSNSWVSLNAHFFLLIFINFLFVSNRPSLRELHSTLYDSVLACPDFAVCSKRLYSNTALTGLVWSGLLRRPRESLFWNNSSHSLAWPVVVYLRFVYVSVGGCVNLICYLFMSVHLRCSWWNVALFFQGKQDD